MRCLLCNLIQKHLRKIVPPHRLHTISQFIDGASQLFCRVKHNNQKDIIMISGGGTEDAATLILCVYSCVFVIVRKRSVCFLSWGDTITEKINFRVIGSESSHRLMDKVTTQNLNDLLQWKQCIWKQGAMFFCISNKQCKDFLRGLVTCVPSITHIHLLWSVNWTQLTNRKPLQLFE